MSNHLVVVDGNSLMNRAFFAFKGERFNPDGVPMNAVYGIGKFLKGINNRYQPTHGIVAFDPDGKTFRHFIYPDYKNHRSEKDPSFNVQKPYVKKLFQLFGYKVVQATGYEADDCIGSIVEQQKELFDKISIVSTDKDLLQLLSSDNISLEIPQKGISEVVSITRKTCFGETGISSDAIADYKALAGDSSDGIPGCKGIGEKTAKILLTEHKSLDNLFKNMDSHPERVKTLLLNDFNGIQISYTLAKIVTSLPFNLTPEQFQLAPRAELKKQFILDNNLL